MIFRFFRALYTLYALIMFVVTFFIFFIPLMIPVVFPRQHHLVGVFNRWWAWVFFPLILMPWKMDYREKPDPDSKYIFCPNHFSYLDIPVMGLNHMNTIFVGKSALEKIPFFGFMYRKLHITVNRSSLKSRYQTVQRAIEAIDEGKNLVIFPEGGIVTEQAPVLGSFKEGPFRIAIEKQIPLVPVTIRNNWIILPDGDWPLLRWGRVEVVFHPPVHTKGLTMEALTELKEKVRGIINNELINSFDNENRSENIS